MDHYIVAIGASAGGLQALKEFFTYRQTTSGESYVIILHSMRDYESKLVDILSRLTDIKISWIADRLAIQPDNVYVLPPGDKVEILNGEFRLTKRSDDEVTNFTINHLFESLAKEARDKAIGIVMSGTGTDGTDGSHAIEDHGGIVIVQDPNTAQFEGMPRATVQYDRPDYLRAPKEMPELIDAIINGREDKQLRKGLSLFSSD